MLRSLICLALFGAYLSYHEAEALNKECMQAMGKMMEKQTKLLVPCIEKLGLTTGPEKKEKAMVEKYLNTSINLQDYIKLDVNISVPSFVKKAYNFIEKLKISKNLVTSTFQCIMKCVMIDGKMLAPDGSVDMDLAQKMLEDLPDALKDKAQDIIGECGHHAAMLEPNEASCESYREFVSCMLDVSLKMCNE